MLVETMLFAVIFFIISLVVFAFFFSLRFKAKKATRYSDDWSVALAAAIGFVIIGFLLLALTAMPFNPKFWVMTPQTSTISSIENKVVTSGDSDSTSLTSEFVLTLEDDIEPVVLTDSRVQTYKAGDSINLNCAYKWVYGGMDVKTCKIFD